MITRRGILLLEMGVAITLTAAILYGSTMLFSAFQRIDRTARERAQHSRELSRLAEQFRGDVHAAREMETVQGAAEKSLLRLKTLDNLRVQYDVQGDGQLARTVFDKDKAIERDLYEFGGAAGFSIDARRDNISLVTLTITMSRIANGQSDAPKLKRRVTALLSRDHRYAMDRTEKPKQ